MGLNLKSLLNIYRMYLNHTGSIRAEKAEIALLVEGSSDSVTLPVVKADLPTIENTQKNDVFESVIGDVSVIGLLGLRKVTFDDYLLPNDVSKYSFAKGDNASTILNFIQDNHMNGQPFRIVITKGGYTVLNMACLIDEYSHYQDTTGDTHLNMSLTEYRTYNQQTGGLET